MLAVKAAGHCAAVEAGESQPTATYDVDDSIEWSLTDRPEGVEDPEKQVRSQLVVQQQRVRRRAGIHERLLWRLKGEFRISWTKGCHTCCQLVRRRRLAKDLGMNRLTDRRLRTEIYKWEGRVRVRKCQLLKAEQKLKQIGLRRRVAAVGLTALSDEQGSLELGGRVDIDAFTTFWENIWGIEGEADPQDDMIVEWGEAVAAALEETEMDEIPWDATWGLAVSKQAPWKAPGPDGLASSDR